MHARVTMTTAQSGKMKEAIKISQDSILSAAKKQKGYKGYLLLTNIETNEAITISIWDTEADMNANETSGYYKQQIAKVVPILAGQPILKHFDVNIRE